MDVWITDDVKIALFDIYTVRYSRNGERRHTGVSGALASRMFVWEREITVLE